jgi:hypothetical protein
MIAAIPAADEARCPGTQQRPDSHLEGQHGGAGCAELEQGRMVPRYAPELNDIEQSWGDLKRHHLAHRTFQDAREPDAAINAGVDGLNQERRVSQS